MATALVVDESKSGRRLVAGLLAKRAGLEVVCAADVREAMERVGRALPDLILTGLTRAGLGGSEFVTTIRSRYPTIPVVLMTANGNDNAAAEALRLGATSYVPKKFLSRDLMETVDRVLGASGVGKAGGGADVQAEVHCEECGDGRVGCRSASGSESLAAQYLLEAHCEFVVENNPFHFDPLVRYVEHELARLNLFDDTGLMRLGIAFCEALSNAVNHGNLGVDSDLRESDMAAYYRLLEERRGLSPYRERKVYVSTRVTRSFAELKIRDEGRGFDPRNLPDPTDPSRLEKTSGRGMLLIRTFMDEVTHNATGNEITMLKRAGR